MRKVIAYIIIVLFVALLCVAIVDMVGFFWFAIAVIGWVVLYWALMTAILPKKDSNEK